jgi:hypothetical protein
VSTGDDDTAAVARVLARSRSSEREKKPNPAAYKRAQPARGREVGQVVGKEAERFRGLAVVAVAR